VSRATVRVVRSRRLLHRLVWTGPWLAFQAFPVVDLVTTPRPAAVRAVAAALLLVFNAAYIAVFGRVLGDRRPALASHLLLVGVLGAGLAVWLGVSWAGLLIYVSSVAAVALPQRWIWPVVTAAGGICTAVIAAHGLLGDLVVLPLFCFLTALTLQGTRHLLSVNAELREARDELARNAVAEERLRFARDLHDLLGHSLSLIALKSELAGRLAERDPARAREEMADVEAAARRALAEVRDAVSGYRQVSLAQALAEARSALSAAGITLRAPAAVASLPGPVDAVLGWVVREATTNVLRHSGAGTVAVELAVSEDGATLTVIDDGRGAPATGGGGTGLAGLAERAAALGGSVESGSVGGGADGGRAPGRGFRVRAVVPVSLPAAAEVAAR
jgi:two-component system, NarL family, sensor histidine kinase DesK